MRQTILALAWIAVASIIAGQRPAGAVTIQIDYSYDAANFFDTQAKRDLLQTAADTLADRLGDDLAAISPGGANTWTAQFFNPATGALQDVENLQVPADTLILYAGGRNLGSNTLGSGGYGGWSASGTSPFVETVRSRGEANASGAGATDFGPWGGAITFTTSAGVNWNFSTSAPSTGQSDFLSVAMHELGHFLGFGLSESWNTYVSGTTFTGPASMAEYDLAGGVPLSPSTTHWANGTTDGGQETALDPSLTTGYRKLFTALDYAGLDDIGWDILPPEMIPGDVNDDGKVDIFDVAFISSYWGGSGPEGDANGDGAVDIFDVAVVSGNWGAGGPYATAVPEPGTWTLAMCAAAVGAGAWMRRRAARA